MANTLYDRTIAFAGICKLYLVQQVAKDGRCDKDAFGFTQCHFKY